MVMSKEELKPHGKDLSSVTATAECTINSEPSWYVKFLSYLKNHNRVAPGKLELPDCDFFIVAPRRTLRVLKPPLKTGGFYEASNDRPESVNDSFFARWSRRPHPSGNCRCSFRQSSRLSTTEEQIISAEINRIRTSLCEAERTGQDIEELEQRISINLENLIPVTGEPKTESSVDEKLAAIARVGPVAGDEEIDGRIIKNKIVEDLERYINDLLEEILTDTIKFIAESESVVRKVNDCSINVCVNPEHLNFCNSLEDVNEKDSIKKVDNEKLPEILEVDNNSFNNISFAFHGDADRISDKGDSKEEVRPEGYVNRAFLGSPNDPDSLDFYLHKPIRTNVNLEHLDCVDSGINSVETVEFQPDQEPSLEESLMEIIDAKLGRGPLRKSWEDLSADGKNSNETSETANNEESPKCESVTNIVDKDTSKYTETIQDEEVEIEKQINENTISQNESNKIDKIPERDNNSTNDSCTNEISNDLEATNDLSFDKLRLELQDERSSTEEVQLRNKNGISIFRKKFSFNESRRGREDSLKIKSAGDRRLRNGSKFQQVELDDYRKKWSEPEGSNLPIENQNPRDLVMFRKNRKPTIVFLHGFGSTAEVFNHQLEYFSSLGYPCVAPDMLGHGMSSAPDRSRDYHFEKLLKDLDTVLHHYAFKPGQKCVLVAHNYGCSFATALACKYDSNIHQLVLISGGGPTPLAPPSTENAGHCCLRTVFAPLLMCGLRREILYSARGRQHPYCGPENAEQWPSHMKYVLDGMVWPDGDYVFHRRICTPTLLVHGLRDNKVSLVQECQMERTMMKAFLEAMPAAGHCPMTDCPDQLNHMIHCFIDLWKNKKW